MSLDNSKESDRFVTVAEKRMGADPDGAHQPSVDDVSYCLGMV